MTKHADIGDAEIAREFHLRKVRGPTANAVGNAALRICLANCVHLRKKEPQQAPPTSDGKRLAAGDSD
ncbi:hypothetical protein PQR14_21410 [Paraburkholderia bryophila]|uniref:hypothetical protein n=1 Tax=Paraburkholderia bryophila TaxID=420952 RepID=UPI0038BAEC55